MACVRCIIRVSGIDCSINERNIIERSSVVRVTIWCCVIRVCFCYICMACVDCSICVCRVNCSINECNICVRCWGGIVGVCCCYVGVTTTSVSCRWYPLPECGLHPYWTWFWSRCYTQIGVCNCTVNTSSRNIMKIISVYPNWTSLSSRRTRPRSTSVIVLVSSCVNKSKGFTIYPNTTRCFSHILNSPHNVYLYISSIFHTFTYKITLYTRKCS